MITPLFVTGILCLLLVIAAGFVGVTITDPRTQRRFGIVTFTLATVGAACLGAFLVLVVRNA